MLSVRNKSFSGKDYQMPKDFKLSYMTPQSHLKKLKIYMFKKNNKNFEDKHSDGTTVIF